ncbi:uncharacterized protein LOC143735027 [Siphateles boraxobius]|uniref:uncharacterized protein LOC143735027 n=1 Tax=Siphateles boraxobius TaxID=180520 RepID=UPI004062C773
MMSAFILIIFPLVSSGVFGDDVVTVVEGDSVTLHADTKIQIKEIDWRVGEILIASIDIETSDILYEGPSKDRLKLDNQTGDLKITYITISDAGSYNLHVNSEKPPSKKFTVHVVPVDKMLSVFMGEFVTLYTGVFEPKKYDVIRWRFADQKSPIAEVNRATGNISIYGNVADGSFKTRLQLDYWTGSLTITNTKPTDSGEYEVDIISSSKYTIHKTFSVTVRGEIQSVPVKEGASFTLNTDVTELLEYDSVLWMFGDTLIVTTQNNNIKDGPDERFRDRLNLDHHTGSLTITNARITDSGDYKLQISSSEQIIHKKFIVTVTGLSAGAIAGICVAVGVVLLVCAAVAGVFYYRHRISELKEQRIDEVRTVSVIEGESITLNPDEEHKDDKLVWSFGGIGIAEMKISDHSFTVHNDVLDGRFRDRLKLNPQTESLIIMNIKTTDSGEYELLISRPGKSSIKRFRVSVFDQTDDIQTVSVKKGESLELKTGVDDIQKFEEILWRFGLDTLLAEIRGKTKYISPFQDSVELDHQTGSLTIKNSKPRDAGVYMLSKIERGNITTKLFRVEVESTDNRNNPVEESVRRNNPEEVPLTTVYG